MPVTSDSLMEAASTGQYKVLATLLQPDPAKALQEADLTLEKLAATAASNNHPQIVKYCLSLGANVNDYAVIKGVLQSNSLEMYKTVVPAGYDLKFDHGGMTGGPLIWAALKNDVPLATYLLEHGAEVNRDIQTRVYLPLAKAAMKNSVEMMELFIGHGALIDRSGALIVAADNGNLEAVKCLISHGANSNVMRCEETILYRRTSEEETALHKAVKGGHEDVAAFLLARGANPNLKDPEGLKALDIARERRMTGIAELLQSHSS